MVGKINIIGWVILVLLLTGACSHLSTSIDPQKALEKRVEQLWQARQAQDNDAIYDLLDKKYRDEVPRKEFVKKDGLTVLSYTIQEITIDGQTALATAVFETRKVGMKMRLNLKEAWILEDGQWRLNMFEMTKKGPFGKWGR